MESDERELWIEKYINNQLDDKSLKEFRLLVDNDPLLATELKAYEKIDSGLHGLGLNKLKSEVNTWESALKKQIPKQEINLKPVFYYSVAATILILIVSVVFLFNKRQNSLSALYTAYYAPYPDMILTRGDTLTNSIENMLILGIEAYNRKQYQEAADHIKAYMQARPEEKGVALYLAIAYMELNQTAQAEENFLIAREDENFIQQSTWYQALLYLKMSDRENAIQLLQAISGDPQHYRQDSAQKLLGSL